MFKSNMLLRGKFMLFCTKKKKKDRNQSFNAVLCLFKP